MSGVGNTRRIGKFWAPVRSETVVSVLVDCSVNVTHVVALLSAQYTKARVGYCNGSATNANIMEAFLAYTFFLHRVLTFPASVPQKILTVEVQNPAPLLGLLAPPLPPTFNIGKPGPATTNQKHDSSHIPSQY